MQLLEQHTFGRIAVMVEGQPQIFPVNYAVMNRIIVFRTAPGTKLSYAPTSKVAFEIDDYDASTGVGWSVLVQGVALDATSALDDISWTARGAVPHPLAPGEKAHRIAISPEQVTGRRFVSRQRGA
jgi:nitroimidazol reductase NimA-like FMN-containing flavoprotein (pyridoxamine 5'-phosphate oxidase superfamily)